MPMPPLATDLPPEALRLLARAREHHTEHEGRRTVWHRWGEGAPLVVLHGGSGSWTHWLRNIDALAGAGYTLWLPDLPGFGDSDPPAKGQDADALVAPLAAGIAQLLGGAGWGLVGFSFGGLTAGLLAATQPSGLERLVIVGAPALGTGGRPVKLLEWRHLARQEEREAVHRHNLAALMLHDPTAITELAVALHSANLVRDRMRRRRLSQTDALEQALKQVQVPLAAIYGAQDVLFRHRMGELEASLRALPRLAAFELIPDAGHWVQFEAPRELERVLVGVLGQMGG